MAAEGRRVINAACCGYGILILINHGKVFSVTTVRELGFEEFPHLGDNSVFPNSSVLPSLYPVWAFFMHYIFEVF